MISKYVGRYVFRQSTNIPMLNVHFEAAMDTDIAWPVSSSLPVPDTSRIYQKASSSFAHQWHWI
jgi:hypothetical protein